MSILSSTAYKLWCFNEWALRFSRASFELLRSKKNKSQTRLNFGPRHCQMSRFNIPSICHTTWMNCFKWTNLLTCYRFRSMVGCRRGKNKVASHRLTSIGLSMIKNVRYLITTFQNTMKPENLTGTEEEQDAVLSSRTSWLCWPRCAKSRTVLQESPVHVAAC